MINNDINEIDKFLSSLMPKKEYFKQVYKSIQEYDLGESPLEIDPIRIILDSFTTENETFIEYIGCGLRIYLFPYAKHIFCRYGLSDGSWFLISRYRDLNDIVELLKVHSVEKYDK